MSSSTAVVTGPIVGRRLGEADAEGDQALVLGRDVVNGEGGEGDAVLLQGGLEGPGGGVRVGFEEQLDAVGLLGRDDRQPAMLAQRDLGALLEAETSV